MYPSINIYGIFTSNMLRKPLNVHMHYFLPCFHQKYAQKTTKCTHALLFTGFSPVICRENNYLPCFYQQYAQKTTKCIQALLLTWLHLAYAQKNTIYRVFSSNMHRKPLYVPKHYFYRVFTSYMPRKPLNVTMLYF